MNRASPWSLNLSSIRVRLTLWNVAVVGMVLVGFALALSYTVRASLAAAVDQELEDRVASFRAGWARRPGFRPRDRMGLPGIIFPRPERPPEPWAPDGEEPPGFRPMAGPPGEPSELPPGDDSGEARGSRRSSPLEDDRRGFFRQPRIFDAAGNPMLPFYVEPWDPLTLDVALSGVEYFSTVEWEGEPIRVFSAPITNRLGNVEGVIQVAYSLTEHYRLNAGLTRTLLILIPLVLLVAGVGGVFLSDRAIRPVRRITQTAAEISAQDLSRRLEVHGRDELAELSATFNGMIGRLEESFHRLEAAYEQQRRFTGDASHELRTPLTTIKANTSLMLSGAHSAADYREALVAVDHAADTMQRIVQDLLLLARSDSGRLGLTLTPVDLNEVVQEAVALFRDQDGASIVVETAGPTQVQGDLHHLVRLLTNLLENARRHTPPDGRITVRTRTEGELAVLEVADTGEGIPAEHLPHVCERFYRVDAARSRAQGGSGLGLAICQSIVQAHGGTLEIASEVGKGTCVRVNVPAGTPE